MLKYSLAAAMFLISSTVAAADVPYVRKLQKPKFFIPESELSQPEKLPMPRYTEGEEITIKEAKPEYGQRVTTTDEQPEYQQKYDDYNSDLAHIDQTGQLPNNQNLNDDLAQMNSTARFKVNKKPYQQFKSKKFDKALEKSLQEN